MTELDIPRPILMDVNRIRDYFNIICVVTEKIGEDRADKGFHTAAAGGRNSYQHRVREITTLSPYLETMITGMS